VKTSQLKGTIGERVLTQADINGFENVLRYCGPVETLERIAQQLMLNAMVSGERGDKIGFSRQYEESKLVAEAAKNLKSRRKGQ
jgi:hypothetical protein